MESYNNHENYQTFGSGQQTFVKRKNGINNFLQHSIKRLINGGKVYQTPTGSPALQLPAS